MLLERADEAFGTAVAFGCADKGRRTGAPQKPSFLLKHLRPILTPMLMPKEQAMGDVLPESPTGGPHPLANGLQRFKPRSLLGCMETHTLRRVMIHRDKDGHLPVR